MKNLVICCDGTWNSPKMDHPSNVWKIFQALEITDLQPCYYDEGVGTSGPFIHRLLDGATGRGLSRNVIEAYSWLIENYEEDDHIFVFGFSRGAFTVRSLAGMIRKCGILRPDNASLIRNAYTLYRDGTRDPYSNAAKSFRNEHSLKCNVYFIGVFDTIGTLGIPLTLFSRLNARKFRFHDQSLSRRIKYGYQAVALDEFRKHFKPCLWQNSPVPGQIIEQVWFSGSHSDVGGGTASVGLSDITLDWMMQKASAAGLHFQTHDTLHPDCSNPITNSRTGIYKLYPPRHRELFKTSFHTESVHPTVHLRVQSVPGYHPVQLERM